MKIFFLRDSKERINFSKIHNFFAEDEIVSYKKRKELGGNKAKAWLLSRILVKYVFIAGLVGKRGEYKIFHPRDIVLKSDGKKPELFIKGKNTNFAVSLSHTPGIAAFAISEKNNFVGIDIEKKRNFKVNIIEKFANVEERGVCTGSLSESNFRAYFSQLWTIKEAALKALGVGLRISPRKVAVYNHLALCHPRGKIQKGRFAVANTAISGFWCSQKVGNYFLSLAIIKKSKEIKLKKT